MRGGHQRRLAAGRGAPLEKGAWAVGALLALGWACSGPNPAYRRASGQFSDGGADQRDAEGELDSPPPPPDRDQPDDESQSFLDAPEPGPDLVPDSPEADLATEIPAPVDMDPPLDVATDAGAEAALPACGTYKPDVSNLMGTDGIAIAPDGTMYFTSDDGTHGWVGRLRPPRGTVPAALDQTWLRIDNSPLNAGLALNRAGTVLYLASASQSAIYSYDVAGATPARIWSMSGLDRVNDLAVAADDTLFFSLQADRHVHYVLGNTAFKSTINTIGVLANDQAPAGLAFGRDGVLYVGMRKGGSILRLVLENRGEIGRTTWSALSGWANGLAVDDQGRLHVGLYSETGTAKVAVIAPDGNSFQNLAPDGRFSGMAFGRGALDCNDLYVTSPNGPMQRIARPSPGLVLP